MDLQWSKPSKQYKVVLVPCRFDLARFAVSPFRRRCQFSNPFSALGWASGTLRLEFLQTGFGGFPPVGGPKMFRDLRACVGLAERVSVVCVRKIFSHTILEVLRLLDNNSTEKGSSSSYDLHIQSKPH